MSFCTVEKLTIIKKFLRNVAAYATLTEEQRWDIEHAIMEGLDKIAEQQWEYDHM